MTNQEEQLDELFHIVGTLVNWIAASAASPISQDEAIVLLDRIHAARGLLRERGYEVLSNT